MAGHLGPCVECPEHVTRGNTSKGNNGLAEPNMNKNKQNELRSIPSVDAILNTELGSSLVEAHGRTIVVSAVRETINALRDQLIKGASDAETDMSQDAMAKMAEAIVLGGQERKLRRVVNATGIILHTGLGRATMPDAARQALSDLIGSCNIQMDLQTGERIKRETNIRDLVCDLTGAEDAVLVNNNAGATMLVLKALADGKEVVVSRGELIEIGGSFRLPEIMEQSGAILREVGSTNKTHLRDYEKAIGPETALLLKAHKSNYCVVGFTKEVSIGEIATLKKDRDIMVVDDLGCGALVNLEDFGMEHEMTVRESLEAGSDLALFSTDKLIGGPQGGLIVGSSEVLDKIRKHPLYRALRVGKMTLSALEATLRLFVTPEKLTETHPVYEMINKSEEEMKMQADKLATQISECQPDWKIEVRNEPSHLGGGSLPTSELSSVALAITSDAVSAETITHRLRSATVPVIPHIGDNAVLLNMRTIFATEMDDIVAACRPD
jgi:L-seryl-tRNA(Ser) seleniumtransferase